MVIVDSFHIKRVQKPNYQCMCEQYGQFIFGTITRITGTKRLIVKTEDREHSLSKNCRLLIFDPSNFQWNKIESTLGLKAYFPTFYLEAFQKCEELGVVLENRFCVAPFFEEIWRPTFKTYQLAKVEKQKMRKMGFKSLVIHNGLKVYYPKPKTIL